MKLIKINPENPETAKIEMAREILRQGGTIVYPTDTVYGLAANIFHEKAVLKVYQMKKRLKNKPISVCLSQIQDIKTVAQLDPDLEKIVQKILPGPYTLILNKKDNLQSRVTAGTDKIGIRIPNNVICRELSRKFPITTTSANISGHPSPTSARKAQKELDDKPDIILDSGPCSDGISSTVVDLTVTPSRIIREGAGMEKLLSIIK
ncbi:MAG TPA: threonylcarbamoyl-AMP synthase [Methanobacterium sp.]|jgi:L-threonylcarbamoyladenylate synthase|nr:threonylcarbamoyl-AMP synthase [Methanobacterium sp.]